MKKAKTTISILLALLLAAGFSSCSLLRGTNATTSTPSLNDSEIFNEESSSEDITSEESSSSDASSNGNESNNGASDVTSSDGSMSNSASSENMIDKIMGCFSTVDGISVGIAMAGLSLAVLLKKKEDE